MALKIRLTRLGDKGNPFYRVVVTESRSPRDGKFIEVLGTYDPKGKDASAVKIDVEVANGWLAKGATPTDTAKAVLTRAGIAFDKPKTKTSTPKPKAKVEKKKK
jgi:small subunit ribosomal protein S16